MLHVSRVRYLRDYILRLDFDNGVRKDVDLSDELHGEMFEPLRDTDVFRTVRVSPETGTIEWSNGADFAPEFLYEVGTPAGRSGVNSGPDSGESPPRPAGGQEWRPGANHERSASDGVGRDDTAVSIDPGIHGGDLVFAGTRVPVHNLIDCLKGGYTLERFLGAFPTVQRWQVEAFLDLSPGAVEQSLASPADDLESAALALPPAERARLADRLLASLAEDGEVEAAWAEEIRRRLEAYRSGQIESVPASQVIEEARARLGARGHPFPQPGREGGT